MAICLLELSYWQSVWQNAVGCGLGNFLTVIIPLAILWLTIWMDRRQRNRLDRANQRNNLRYFKNLVNNAIRSGEQQNTAIGDFVAAIRTRPVKLPMLTFLPIYDFRRISENTTLDNHLLSFTGRYGLQTVDQFGEIISSVDYLTTEISYLPEMVKRGIDYDHERQIQFREVFRSLYGKLREYMRVQDYTQLPPFAARMQEIIQDFWQGYHNDEDIEYYLQHFIGRVNLASLQFLDQDPFGGYHEFAELSLYAREIYGSIERANSEFADQMEEIITHINEGLNSLRTSAAMLLADPLEILAVSEGK